MRKTASKSVRNFACDIDKNNLEDIVNFLVWKSCRISAKNFFNSRSISKCQQFSRTSCNYGKFPCNLWRKMFSDVWMAFPQMMGKRIREIECKFFEIECCNVMVKILWKYVDLLVRSVEISL
jgi:hypothetical protein